MENNALRDRIFADNEHEEIPDSFVCCVCLDLLYKPIVLSCGHICCFWCVYNSMNCLRESSCPVCRHQYYHFPTVCQMLHFLLLKIYSVPYKRREEQTLEEEKKSGFYSPQFDPETCESQAKFGHSGIPSSTSIMNLTSNSCKVGTSECMEQLGSTTHDRDEGTGYSNGEPDIVGTPAKRKKLPQEDISLQQKLSVADVTCTMCKQLLFHPVVLNCGHVYCQTCVVNTDDDMLRCQVCQSPHPSRFPKVCLELDHFLEEQFPEEYRQRRDAIELKQIKVKRETPSCSLDKGNKGENTDWWSDPDSKVHVGVGCDFCGMFPIIGDRYRCADCTEKMGFDLCGDCYATRSKLPGRFNQQHTSEHKFKLEQSNIIQNIMLRLATAQLGDTSIDLESVGNLEIASDSHTMFDDGEDNHSDSETTN